MSAPSSGSDDGGVNPMYFLGALGVLLIPLVYGIVICSRRISKWCRYRQYLAEFNKEGDEETGDGATGASGDAKKTVQIPGLSTGGWIAGNNSSNNSRGIGGGADSFSALFGALAGFGGVPGGGVGGVAPTIVAPAFDDFRVSSPRLEDDGKDGAGDKKDGAAAGHSSGGSEDDTFSDAGNDSSAGGFQENGDGGSDAGGDDDPTTDNMDEREKRKDEASAVSNAILSVLQFD
jgi:hypothetical protein